MNNLQYKITNNNANAQMTLTKFIIYSTHLANIKKNINSVTNYHFIRFYLYIRLVKFHKRF